MRTLLARRRHRVRARGARRRDLFCYRSRKAIGGVAAVLGGLDSSWSSPAASASMLRPFAAEICAGLAYLGIEIDEARNEAREGIISSRDSRATVRVVATNEERTIARHARRVLFAC